MSDKIDNNKVCFHDYKKNNNRTSPKSKTFTKKNFLKHTKQYYLKSCPMHTKYLKCKSCNKQEKDLRNYTALIDSGKPPSKKLIKQYNKTRKQCNKCLTGKTKKCNDLEFSNFVKFFGAYMGKCKTKKFLPESQRNF